MLSSAKNWLSTLNRANLLALHLNQTRLTRLDLSCPRWPGDQHCEIIFVPIIPVSIWGERARGYRTDLNRHRTPAFGIIVILAQSEFNLVGNPLYGVALKRNTVSEPQALEA